MAQDFTVRRDSSTNNVPTVGYNDGVDAQDVLLFGVCKVTERLLTDGVGNLSLSNFPVSISGEIFEDALGVRRGRNLNNDIIIKSPDGITAYYAGAVSPTKRTLKVYTNSARTVVATGADVSVTYYKRMPIKINENGELVIESQSQQSGTQDVNIASTSDTIPVMIKASDVTLSEKIKDSVMFKFEGAIAAGASATPLELATGDGAKDSYITNIICYYNGTDNTSDPNVGFWFDVLDTAGKSVGTADLFMPPRSKGMLQLSLGEIGIKVPAGGKLRFRVGSSWAANTIHVLALGWQYTN